MQTHYEILGVSRESSAAEIRTAYRRIALEHHPDKSDTADSRAIFLSAKESYEVLSDPIKKKSYDFALDLMVPPAPRERPQPKAEPKTEPKQEPKPQPKPEPKPEPPKPTVPQMLAQLQTLFGRGQYADAERLAREILDTSSREAIPYAVLGDIARSQGNLNEAAKFYAYAAQFAPANPIYQQRYEELLNRSQVKSERGTFRVEATEAQLTGPIFGAGVVLACASYLVWSGERPTIMGFTVGSLTMPFVAGVAIGASFSFGNLLERFQLAGRTTHGRMGLTLVLGLVAVINFWLAALGYLILGAVQKAFSVTTTRFVLGVGAATLLLTISTLVTKISSLGMLTWSGNVVYIGAICGWMVADAFRG